MKKILIYVSISVSCWLFLNGCAQKQVYYFGEYSNTLYSSEKNQDEASLLKHKQELEKIISESEKRKLLVPPGIFAELGFIYLKTNNSKEAINLFRTEAETYPESKLLMDRLIKMAEKKES